MDYLRQFLQRQNYPADAQTCLLESAEKLQNTPCAAAVFQQYIADYRSGTLGYALANEAIGAAAPAAQVHPYTALLVFYILLCEHFILPLHNTINCLQFPCPLNTSPLSDRR